MSIPDDLIPENRPPVRTTVREVELSRGRIRVARKIKSWESESGDMGGSSVVHVISFDRARTEFNAENWQVFRELLAELDETPDRGA